MNMGNVFRLLKFEDMEVGEEFEPWEYTLSRDLVQKHKDCMDDHVPFYENSTWGRIAPPGILLNDCFRPSKHGGRYGGLHYKYRIEFMNPTRIGARIKVQGRMINKYEVGSVSKRKFVVLEFDCIGDAGIKLAHIKTTVGLR